MVIVTAGQKGGVGKSCSAICIGAEALERGVRVLMVDADPQGTVRTWHGLAQEREHPLPTVVLMGATMHKANELPKMAQDFELTIVDCPPRHSEIQRSALLVADIVVLPCGGSSSDAWALLASLKLIEEAHQRRPALRASILLNRIKSYTALGRGARDVLASTGWPVLASELHDRIAYQESIGEGLGVTRYAPRSEAADEVRALVDELMPHTKKGRNGHAR
jgi:chromosome partitioning protein